MSLKEIVVTNMNQIEPKHVALHQPYEFERYDVSGLMHDNKCTVTFYSIHPGKSNYPYHYHTANEEVFYIISGKGMLETPGGEVEVKAGDVIVIPPCEEAAHKLKNTSESEALIYLDVDTNNMPDTVFYPHSKKVGLYFKDAPPKFHMEDGNVPYFKGE